MKLTVTASPHIRDKRTTQDIMLDVMIALIPTLAAGVIFHGIRGLAVTVVSVFAAVAAEWFYEWVFHKKITVKDGSAAVTGMLLALALPASVPYWIVMIGSAFGIIFVKALCGGLGKNIFNPALGARAFLMLVFPVYLVRYAAVGADLSLFSEVDIASSATPLHEMRKPMIPEAGIWDLLIGRIGGCIGEVSAIAILLGGGYLLVRKVISVHIPLSYLGTVAVLSLIFSEMDRPILWMVYNLLSGGVLLGTFFMATDYSSSPTAKRGKIIYGIGCGVLTVFFRKVGLYPESVTYAILLMNAVAWAIDRFSAPRVFGTQKGGQA